MAKTTIGKINTEMFGEMTNANEKEICLWGKNFVPNSTIKFEYYMGALHSSFPDFVMKDANGRIHIFEVKSVNIAPSMIDNNIYKAKIAELKKCYQYASKKTGQIFYLPIQKDEAWQITQYINGAKNILSKYELENFVKKCDK